MVRISTFFKVMALIAIMFGVSFNAEAQLLGGIAKAIKNKSQQSKQEKAMETPTGDAKDAKNGPATFSVGRDGELQACTWNPETLEITMLCDIAGNKKGDVIKYDPSTGKFTNNRGEYKGSMSEEGTIESIHIGTMKFVVKTYGNTTKYTVNKDGKQIGNLTADHFVSLAIMGPYTGNPSRLLTAYVYYGLLLDKRTYSINILKFDPELKYTVEQLDDKVKWMDQESINKIMKYESSLPGAGFKETYPEFKNCKVAAVGLMSNQWAERTETDRQGYKHWFYVCDYWVVYELADGRNVVTFSVARENSRYGDVISKWQVHDGEFNEVSDWVRK